MVIHNLLGNLDIYPVLIDIGAAGSSPTIWDSIAKDSIYIGFDPNLKEPRDISQEKYFRSITINKAVTNDRKNKNVLFNVTQSPYCSSILKPDLDSLMNFIFLDLFVVKERKEVETIALDTVLNHFSLKKIDWLKTDSQGIDLRVFNSIADPIRSHILALDMEPGFINAYQGEDLFIDIHKDLTNQGFWLSDMNVCGTVRMQKSTLTKAQKICHSIDIDFVKAKFRKTPCWSEIRYLRTLNYMAQNKFGKREYILLWIFSILDAQYGFALDIIFEYKKLFGEDGIWQKMKSETLFNVKRLETLPISEGMMVAIFGSGEKGKFLYDHCKKNNIQVACFIDNDSSKWGKKVDNIEIVSPENIDEIAKRIDCIVIASQWEREIYYQIKGMNSKNIYLY